MAAAARLHRGELLQSADPLRQRATELVLGQLTGEGEGGREEEREGEGIPVSRVVGR